MKVWSWLIQNASAVQAIGGLLSFLVAAVTVPVLLATKRVARKAADAAVEQALAAQAQVRASEASSRVNEQQLDAARASAVAEKEHSEVIRKQYLATLRPVLIFVRRVGPTFTELVLENQSDAFAFDIAAHNGVASNLGKSIEVSPGTLGPGSVAYLQGIEYGRAERDSLGGISYPDDAPISVRYRSLDGRWFRTVLANVNSGRFLKQHVEEERLIGSDQGMCSAG